MQDAVVFNFLFIHLLFFILIIQIRQRKPMLCFGELFMLFACLSIISIQICIRTTFPPSLFWWKDATPECPIKFNRFNDCQHYFFRHFVESFCLSKQEQFWISSTQGITFQRHCSFNPFENVCMSEVGNNETHK